MVNEKWGTPGVERVKEQKLAILCLNCLHVSSGLSLDTSVCPLCGSEELEKEVYED